MVKTRDKLIDIARQLFAHKGIENTTMNDIAIAAEKGRRTIYTYFKNKRDIYNAVVETESDKVLSKLSEIAKLQIPADEKLMEFIFQRFDAMKDLVHRNGGKAGMICLHCPNTARRIFPRCAQGGARPQSHKPQRSAHSRNYTSGRRRQRHFPHQARRQDGHGDDSVSAGSRRALHPRELPRAGHRERQAARLSE